MLNTTELRDEDAVSPLEETPETPRHLLRRRKRSDWTGLLR